MQNELKSYFAKNNNFIEESRYFNLEEWLNTKTNKLKINIKG